MEIRKSVSVVIPNYNGSRLLEQYLPYTFQAVKNADITSEIIIVDDCSKDDSVEFIKQVYPQAVLLINPEKRGFAYACNRGIETARYELILILDSAIKLSPDYFAQQWKYFLAWDTFGVIGRITNMEDGHLLEAAMVAKFCGLKLKTSYLYYTNDNNNRLFTFSLPGFNALINSSKLKQLGGFYEIFSHPWFAGTELSIRAWRLKWKCYYEHNSVCSCRASVTKKNYEFYRDWYYLHAIHFNGLERLALYFQIIITDLIPLYFTGRTWIWKSYKELFTARKAIKQYKAGIKKMMSKHETRVSIFNLVSIIKSSAKNKKSIRIKSSII